VLALLDDEFVIANDVLDRFAVAGAGFLAPRHGHRGKEVSMKILIVDDHPTDLKLISQLLRLNGHTVYEKTSSEGVLDSILIDRPDVIIVDLRLPDSDGLTLTRQLKADADTAQIPIVAVTAYPDDYPRSELLSAGCVACIVKPFDTRGLSKQIEEIVFSRTGS
jgi:two-component system cell cycle response regulator